MSGPDRERRVILGRIEAAEKSIDMFQGVLKEARRNLAKLDAQSRRARLRANAGRFAHPPETQ